MKTIGVRELRQRASAYLKEVQEGRSLEVTAHGRPVAQLVPVRRAGRRRVLATRGRLRPPATLRPHRPNERTNANFR